MPRFANLLVPVLFALLFAALPGVAEADLSCTAPQVPCTIPGGTPPQVCATPEVCVSLQTHSQVIQDNPNPSSPNPGVYTQAQPANQSGGGLINPLKVDSIEKLLALILAAVVQIGSILLVLALVYVGFLFVAAQGNTEQLKKAREALVWTVIGGIVLLGAQAIALVIQSTVQGL